MLLVWLWVALSVGLALALAFDLGWHRRPAPSLTTGEALLATLGWLAAALVFDVFVYAAYEPGLLDLGPWLGFDQGGPRAAVEFLTAFLATKTLALANVFVIAIVLSAFAIPLDLQHRVLFWGLIAAVALRVLFLLPGLALVEAFAPIGSVLGVLLLATSVKLLVDRVAARTPPERRPLRWLLRRVPMTDAPRGRAFVVRSGMGWSITPLGAALVVILSSDLLFAADSLPAAFAVTRDPFLVLTSNAFAALGLRALYFLIAPLLGRFRPLELSLVFVLAYIGVKSLLAHVHPIPTLVSLSIVTGLLSVGVVASFVAARRLVIPVPSAVEADLASLVRFSLRHARRIIVTAVGATVLLVGVALLVLPGPGLAVIVAGLALLSTEFVWARRWMRRLRSEVERHNPLRRGRPTSNAPSDSPPPAHSPDAPAVAPSPDARSDADS